MTKSKPKIGFALGGGAARGWAHIGIIKALEKQGIKPDIIAGTSIGALIGATYVTGFMDEFEEWITKLNKRTLLSMLDIRFSGGIIHGKKLIDYLSQGMKNVSIENLDIPYGAVATDLESGNEVWLREGHIIEAVRASIALPGLFSPVNINDIWLSDGGLVNPVPVSLCRALGADFVIAVDLNARLLDSKLINTDGNEEKSATAKNDILQSLKEKVSSNNAPKEEIPATMEVIHRSINIMTNRITRSRLAGDPPDLLFSPDLNDIGLFDFHKAKTGIQIGRREVVGYEKEINTFKQRVKAQC